MLTLYHCGQEIKNITTDGTFGSHLFFSANSFVSGLTCGESVKYSINVDENTVCTAKYFYDNTFFEKEIENWDIVEGVEQEVMELFGVDRETAQDLLCENTLSFDLDNNFNAFERAEKDWELQKLQAKAAKIFGFDGVIVQDEYGESIMYDMLKKEEKLIKH